MNWLKPTAKLGFYAGCTVLAVLIVPPLLAPQLEAWQVALAELPRHREIQAACGAEPQIELSRWFYSVRSTGSTGQARFDGWARSPTCNRGFVVELERSAARWRVAGVIWDDS